MKTYSAKPTEITRKWYLIDAEDLVLGRLAAEASVILRGKKKPYFSTNLDCGDYLVIVNAEKVHLTKNKAEVKKYYWHTGHPGGIKEKTAKKELTGEFPERVIYKAIQRMITRSPLGREQLRKLYIYQGEHHPHAGQQPEPVDFGSQNRKNKKG